MENKHEELTQKYSTWGDKLLQHADVLHSIQKDKIFKPITVQLSPTETCSSGCPFCSVAERPLKSYLPMKKIKKVLDAFKKLGAKAVEITGGGEPMLYRDKETKEDINDIIEYAYSLGYDIGIITNTGKLNRLKSENFTKLKWLRISLIKLDEGFEPEDYDFCGFPEDKMGLSYIIYDCLEKGNNAKVRNNFKDIIDEIDINKKIFIKDIGFDDSAYNDGCYVGLIRPYVAPNPHGKGEYKIYMCTSHVLNTKNYDLDYSLCDIDDIIPTWEKCNKNYQEKGYPYELKGNCGKNWNDSCKFCFYKFNNKILHTVAQEMPDKNFA